MNFQNNLYTILSESGSAGGGAGFTVLMNPEHVIYRAHFPEDPITPGVCIIQIGLELLGRALDCTPELCRVKNVKFLSILRPDGVPVDVAIRKIDAGDSADTVSAQMEFSASGIPVAKMSLICRKPAASGNRVPGIPATGVSGTAADGATAIR